MSNTSHLSSGAKDDPAKKSQSPTFAGAVNSPADRPQPKPVRGWRQLQKLLPYMARCKGQVAVGLVILAAMGIVGSLQPLAFGVILDCLSGNAQPLERLSRMSPRLIHRLIPAYQPSSGRTLIIYCLAALAIVALKGVFSFWSRWILIGLSRDIEYDLRNDLLDRLLLMEPEFYVRNRTGELMSRATNDLNQVRMVLGPGIMYSATTLRNHGPGGLADVPPFADAQLLGADSRSHSSPSSFGTSGKRDPLALRDHSGGAGHALRKGPGKSGGRARDSRLRAGRRGDSRLRRSQSRLRHPQPEADWRLEHVHARADGADRPDLCAGAVVRRARSDRRDKFRSANLSPFTPTWCSSYFP